jgi:light-regulated signal transduction histidine kinase (bacteriophytochrome)
MSTSEQNAQLRHRLRTPLNHIIGYSEMLLEEGSTSPEAITTLEQIVVLAKQILRVIQPGFSPRPELEDDPLVKLRADMQRPLIELLQTANALTERTNGASLNDAMRIKKAAGDLTSLLYSQSAAQQSGIRERRADRSVAGPAPGLLLVVDDDELNRDILARNLERLGHRLLMAANGRQALTQLENEKVDLVLLDLMMPEMDGVEVLEAMRSREDMRHIPVLMLSAYDELEQVAVSIEAGAEDYLLKPFEPVLLRARVNAALERKRLRDLERQKTAELERAERELRSSNDELQRFVYAASHDLKEPLRTVTAFAQLFTRKYGKGLDEDATELLETIISATGRMADLINDLLAYSDISMSDWMPGRVSTEGVLKETIKLLRQAIEESGAVITHGNLPVVVADHSQLNRLFQNLISNSIKYRSPGEIPRIKIAAEAQNGRWIFSVEDNGIGIPPEHRETVFQVFRRLHGREIPGTGVGLAICQRVVERMGGQIWVDPAPEHGSIFRFDMPVEA